MALFAALLASIIFLWAVLDLVGFAAAALAQLWGCAVCQRMTCLATIEATLLAGSAFFFLRAKLGSCLLGLALPLTLALALLVLALILAFAFSLALVERFHLLPIGIDLPTFVLFPIVIGNFFPCVGLSVLGIDA